MKKPVYFDTQNFPVSQMYFVDSLKLSMDFPLHRHSFVELEYVCSGKGTNIINGVEYPLSAGKISLLLPWHVHELKSDKSDPLQIYKCSFRTDFLIGGNEPLGNINKILLDLGDYQAVTELDENSRHSFERVFQLALEENKRNAKYKDVAMSALITELVILFLRCCGQAKRETYTVWDMVRRIQMEYHNAALTGEEVAREFGYSLTHLNRFLKENTGLTFFEMLQEIRVRSASYLLIYTNLDIEDIARTVGYKSRGGLYKAFERLKGVSPAVFREKNEKHSGQGESMIYSMTYSKLIYYLHRHYAEELTLEGVAKEFHYNKSYLCQLLAKDNTSFQGILNEIRIYNACKMLSISDRKVELIAAEVGFRSVNSFYEIFKKLRGCTPKEYREANVKIRNTKLNQSHPTE